MIFEVSANPDHSVTPRYLCPLLDVCSWCPITESQHGEGGSGKRRSFPPASDNTSRPAAATRPAAEPLKPHQHRSVTAQERSGGSRRGRAVPPPRSSAARVTGHPRPPPRPGPARCRPGPGPAGSSRSNRWGRGGARSRPSRRAAQPEPQPVRDPQGLGGGGGGCAARSPRGSRLKGIRGWASPPAHAGVRLGRPWPLGAFPGPGGGWGRRWEAPWQSASSLPAERLGWQSPGGSVGPEGCPGSATPSPLEESLQSPTALGRSTAAPPRYEHPLSGTLRMLVPEGLWCLKDAVTRGMPLSERCL